MMNNNAIDQKLQLAREMKEEGLLTSQDYALIKMKLESMVSPTSCTCTCNSLFSGIKDVRFCNPHDAVEPMVSVAHENGCPSCTNPFDDIGKGTYHEDIFVSCIGSEQRRVGGDSCFLIFDTVVGWIKNQVHAFKTWWDSAESQPNEGLTQDSLHPIGSRRSSFSSQLKQIPENVFEEHKDEAVLPPPSYAESMQMRSNEPSQKKRSSFLRSRPKSFQW